MIHLITAATARVYVFLLRYMPTNRLISAIRTTRGSKWGILAVLLAVPYLYAAAICTTIIDSGGPRWLCLLVLLLIWNAFKMLWIGPVSVIARIRRGESDQTLTNAENTAAASPPRAIS